MTSEREAVRHLKPLMTHLSFQRNVRVWERDRRKMRRAQSVWVFVCEKGSMGGLNGSNVQNVRKYQNAAGCLGAQHRVWNIYVEF